MPRSRCSPSMRSPEAKPPSRIMRSISAFSRLVSDWDLRISNSVAMAGDPEGVTVNCQRFTILGRCSTPISPRARHVATLPRHWRRNESRLVKVTTKDGKRHSHHTKAVRGSATNPIETDVGATGSIQAVTGSGQIHISELSHQRVAHPLHLRQPRRHVGQFLAHGGGAGGLAVGAAEHGHGGMGVRHVAQLGDDRVQRRQQHRVARALELQGVAGVVDVFAGAGEMHELQRGTQLVVTLQSLLDEVLDRFDVVIGGFLDFLDSVGVLLGKVFIDRADLRLLRCRKVFQFRQSCREGNEILHFYQYAIANESEFRKIGG